MKQPYSFTYKSLSDISEKAGQLGVCLPLSEDTNILNTPFRIGERVISNRMGIAPMEGVDSEADGTPSALTALRYKRLAEGGAGLIWVEAVSIVWEGRSSLKQLLLTRDTLPAYQRLTDSIREAGLRANGFAPYLVMQANHSGRYSRPNAAALPEPIAAFHNPYIEKDHPLDSASIATDEYLERMEEKFGEASLLARKAGFDAIDIKSCHGYLLAELAGAYTRPGKYGGSFENRFRLLFNAIRNAQTFQTGTFQVVSRVGFYDNIPYPYGFGMAADGSLTVDMEEPLRLMYTLHEELGISFINLTAGDPHYDAYATRPFNVDVKYTAEEDPLISVARIFEGAAKIKKAFPSLSISASAPSYLRQFAPNLAAGAVAGDCCDHVCFGRLSFANPHFPNDILMNGQLEKGKACIACSKCSELIRAGEWTGCVLNDHETYLPLYRKLKQL